MLARCRARRKRASLVGKSDKQTGHASDVMLERYIQDEQLFADNAAGALLIFDMENFKLSIEVSVMDAWYGAACARRRITPCRRAIEF